MKTSLMSPRYRVSPRPTLKSWGLPLASVTRFFNVRPMIGFPILSLDRQAPCAIGLSGYYLSAPSPTGLRVTDTRPDVGPGTEEAPSDQAEDGDYGAATAALEALRETLSRSQNSSPDIKYPLLVKKPGNLFLVGCPLGETRCLWGLVFFCLRALADCDDYLSLSFKRLAALLLASRASHPLNPEYRLPTCEGVFNIFHPYDPVAYRVEPLVDPSLPASVSPIQIDHHKVRKRLHFSKSMLAIIIGENVTTLVQCIFMFLAAGAL